MAFSIDEDSSRSVALVAVFAALIAVLDIIPAFGFTSGVWDSWAFLLSPIVGILLGPYLGAYSVGIGSLIGHTIYYREPTELLFMLGLSVGAAVAGFVYQHRWKPVLGIYTAMLLGYFIYPVTWVLPLWGIWDILVGYVFVLAYSVVTARGIWASANDRYALYLLIFCTVIALESDILFRVFVLVPGQVHWLFGWTPEILYDFWLVAGFITPIKVFLAVLVMVTFGRQLLNVLKHHGNSIAMHDSDLSPN